MLNLLPPEIKSRHKTRSRLYALTVAYIIIAAVFILGSVAGATYKLIQDSQVANYESEISQVKGQIGQHKDVSDKLAFLESRLNAAAQFQEKTSWSELINHIAAATPGPVILNSLRLESTAKVPTFVLSGESADRRSAILFHDKLSADASIASVAFESLAESVTADSKIFTFTMRIAFKAQ